MAPKYKPRFLHYLTLAFFLLLFSCSIEKNTPLSVGYHNLTARFNVHFNGYESFNKGIDKVEASHEDDYTQVLPVYILPNENSVGSISPDMDRTQKKAMKLIELHSITVKPEYKSKDLSSRQREYLKKNEYNNWVDNAYMLIGKSYFYQLNFSLALETFRYVTREFEGDPIVNDAKKWMALCYIENNSLKDAVNLLDELGSVRKMPADQKASINAVYAHYFIRQNDYASAISKMKRALKKPEGKDQKMRFTFILAQLYQNTGNNRKAYENYRKVIKMNPPYEMTFNAKINMAGSFEKGLMDEASILDQLKKMLKDDKNLDYRDQIYYAIGNIYLKDGDKREAIRNYLLSASYSTDNIRQKTRTYITLADLYYERPDYIMAQSYYDSAFTILEPDYAEYDLIEAKSQNLNDLVGAIRTVELKDSVLKLALLPRAEINRVIDQIIANVEQKEREEKLLEQQRAQALQLSQMNQIGTTNQGGGWYFYNPTAKSFGIREFKTKWGNRKLEDNWRRSNKKVVTEDQSIELAGTEEGKDEKKLSNKSRDYYMQDIPLTDSAVTASHEAIKEALVNIGLIYKNQFNEQQLSVDAFEELIERYPNDEITLNAYYNLYLIYRGQDEAKANRYKSVIVSQYPESKFAKALTDPEFYKEMERQEKEGPLLYENTLALFQQGNYQQVIRNADMALKKYKDPELAVKFNYLLTLSYGKTTDPLYFRQKLQEFIDDPANKSLAPMAQKTLNYLDSQKPEVKEEQEEEIAQEIYNEGPSLPHKVVIAMNKGADQNQLKFNLFDFNLEKYEDANLEVAINALNDEYLVAVIAPFKNEEQAIAYYMDVVTNKDVLKDVKARGKEIFYISESNFNVLSEDKSLERFLRFFNQNH